MREIKIVVAACVVLLFASFAAAQVPTSGNVFFGYSYYNADLSTLGRSNLSGWTGSLEGRVFPHVGMVADFSQTFGSESVTILCPGPPCPSQSISAHEYNICLLYTSLDPADLHPDSSPPPESLAGSCRLPCGGCLASA